MHGISSSSSTNSAYRTFGKEDLPYYDHNVGLDMASVKWDENIISQSKRLLEHNEIVYVGDAPPKIMFMGKAKKYLKVYEDELAPDSPKIRTEVLSTDDNKNLTWVSGRTKSQSTYFKEFYPDHGTLLQYSNNLTVDRFHSLINSTSRTVETIEERLFDELRTVYKDAKLFYQDLDEAKFELGFKEAATLINSQIFDEKLYPDISIDPYGEFIFSHDSTAGYVDIGLRGEKRLSYHVMNDVLPEETRYDSHKWDEDFTIPMGLYSALKSLKQYL